MCVCNKLHCEVCGNQVNASADLIKERNALILQLDEAKKNIANTRLELEWPVLMERNKLEKALREFADTIDESLLLDESLDDDWDKLRQVVVKARKHLGEK